MRSQVYSKKKFLLGFFGVCSINIENLEVVDYFWSDLMNDYVVCLGEFLEFKWVF